MWPARATEPPYCRRRVSARRPKKGYESGSKEKQYAAFIVDEVSRLEGILRDILSFSLWSQPATGRMILREIAEEALRIFEDTCRDRSIAVKTLFRSIRPVFCDRERILEAVENLVSKAVDAMPHGGTLTMAVGDETVKEASLRYSKSEGHGRRASEQEDMNRIFEPFFTTKESPKGVGLGLSIMKRFVEDSGGLVYVESEVGKGSTFTLHLPFARE